MTHSSHTNSRAAGPPMVIWRLPDQHSVWWEDGSDHTHIHTIGQHTVDSAHTNVFIVHTHGYLSTLALEPRAVAWLQQHPSCVIVQHECDEIAPRCGQLIAHYAHLRQQHSLINSFVYVCSSPVPQCNSSPDWFDSCGAWSWLQKPRVQLGHTPTVPLEFEHKFLFNCHRTTSTRMAVLQHLDSCDTVSSLHLVGDPCWQHAAFDTTLVRDWYDQQTPKFIDTDDPVDSPYFWMPNPEVYSRIYCDVVCESTYRTRDCASYNFITEKTGKPIWAHRPFILCANPGVCELLEDLGLQTFGEWWDESYLSARTWSDHFRRLCATIDTVNSWSWDRTRSIYQEQKSVLEHNHQVLLSRALSPTDWLEPLAHTAGALRTRHLSRFAV